MKNINNNTSKSKLKLYRSISITLMVVSVILIIAGFSSFDNSSLFIVGSILMVLAWPLFGIAVLAPLMSKVTAHTQNVVLDENKNVLTEVNTKSAEIKQPAIRTYAKTIKDEFEIEKKSYCKFCGSSIDIDSVFCKHCGKKLN